MKKWQIYLGLSLMIILVGCSLPDEPGLPTWETSLKFYMLNDIYDLLELAEEDSAIVVTETAEGDSVLGIYQEESEEQEIDLGAAEQVVEEEYAEIGDIALADVNNIDGILEFGDFAEAAGLDLPAQGEEVPEIVPFSFGNVRQTLNPIEEIEYVLIMEGGFHITLTNNMIVGLGDYENGDPFRLRLVHIAGSDTIDVMEEIVLDDRNLATGDSYETEADLNGVMLYREMSLLLSGGSLGTEGEPVVIDYTSQFITEIEFEDNMTAESANCQIGEQTIEDTVSLSFDEDYRIYYAQLHDSEDYELDIHIENGIDVDLDVHVEIPDIFINSDEPYSTNIEIPRSSEGGIFDMTLELSGARLGNDIDLMENIVIYTTAYVDSTEAGDFRIINYEDSYYIEAELSELEFEYVRGVIAAQEQETITEVIELDVSYPEIEEGAEFMFVGESELRINAHTGNSQIPGTITIDARAYNSENEMIQLVTKPGGEIPEVEVPAENEFILSFDSAEYNINELLSFLPQRIEFNVDIKVGDGVSEVIYQRGDLLETRLELEAVLALAAEAWIIPTEDNEVMVQEEEIELDEEQYNAFRSARVKLTYMNTSGMAVTGEILLSDTKSNILSQIYNYDEPDLEKVTIIAIPELSVTEGVEAAELVIEVDHADLDYFLEDFTYVSSRLKLTSSGETYLGGEVRLIGEMEIVIEISQDLVEGEE